MQKGWKTPTFFQIILTILCFRLRYKLYQPLHLRVKMNRVLVSLTILDI